VPAAEAEGAAALLEGFPVAQVWRDPGEGVEVFRILLPAERVEEVLDALESRYTHVEGFRALVLRVEAALPRSSAAEKEVEAESAEASREDSVPPPLRISRAELYSQLEEAARVSRVFLAMVALSTIVAVIGLAHDNPAVVIGAMVIAPLLGPNMALALATTLGDTTLALRALKANGLGLLLALAVAMLLGLALGADPDIGEIAFRTQIGFSDLLLALAAGAAGALAFTSGVPSSVVGVMVAVALLPPLATFGMLLVGGHSAAALHALLLLATNVVCVNLAGVGVFLAQGIRPRTWWEARRSARRARIALIFWACLLLAVAVLVWLSRRAPPAHFG